MSSASNSGDLIRNMEQAEKDLAFYTAIVGCRPTMPAAPAPIPEPIEELADDHEPAEPRRITLWMRHVSHEAKKRIHEAKLRLAS